jgi:DNA-binding GntR family transcriptional regulator
MSVLRSKSAEIPAGPGVLRAEQYLLELCKRLNLKDGDQLPSLAEIGRSSSISRMTVWKAAQRLQEKGVIWGERGRRLVYGRQPSTEIPDSKPADLPWKQIRNELGRKILNGHYGYGGTLPLNKELCFDFHTNAATMRKALQSLADAGIITPKGRRYGMLAAARRKSFRRLILFYYLKRGRPDQNIIQGKHAEDFVREIDTLASSAAMVVERIRYEQAETHYVLINAKSGEHDTDIPIADDIAGYVVINSTPDKQIAPLLPLLRFAKKPVAIYDEYGMSPESIALLPAKARIFSMAGSNHAGMAVGKFLLNAGHRHIAYLSPFHFYDWSQKRLDGLRTIMETAGCHDSVAACVDEARLDNREFALRSISLEKDFSPVLPAMDKSIKAALKKKRANMHRISSAEFGITAGHWSRTLPLLKKTLNNPDVTAVVCSNDAIAIAVKEMLGLAGFADKRNIVIVGFDDSLEALRAGISSYNFNIGAIARSLFSAITESQFARKVWKKKYVEIEGFVVDRLGLQ